MNKYLIPAVLIIGFVVLGIMFFPNSEEKRIREIVNECETNLNDDKIEPLLKYLDKGFIVPEYGLNFEDISSSMFIKKYISRLGQIDVRKIDIDIDGDNAKIYLIARVTSNTINYEMPFEVNAEMKKTNEEWLLKIMNIKPYKLQK